MRPLQNYKTYTNLSVLLNLATLRTRKILSLVIYLSWIPRSPFWITEIEGPLLTYDQMSDNDLLSYTNSLVTIMVVTNHRNIPWGPRCLQSPPFWWLMTTLIINNERARKIKQDKHKQTRKEGPKSSTAQTKSIDMSQRTAYSSDKCTYPWINTKCDTKNQSPDNYELSLALPSP